MNTKEMNEIIAAGQTAPSEQLLHICWLEEQRKAFLALGALGIAQGLSLQIEQERCRVFGSAYRSPAVDAA